MPVKWVIFESYRYSCELIQTVKKDVPYFSYLIKKYQSAPLPQIQLLEKVVPLVVDEDKGREVFHLDTPDRFHAQVFEGPASRRGRGAAIPYFPPEVCPMA